MDRDEAEEVIERLQFPKVTVREGGAQHAGYLTDLSVRLLLIDLRRNGFDVVKRNNT